MCNVRGIDNLRRFLILAKHREHQKPQEEKRANGAAGHHREAFSQ
jgi:hypothetical protein